MLISSAIIAYLLFAVFWDSPTGTLPKRVANIVFRPAYWLGLGHSWSMYSPTVPTETVVVEVRGIVSGEPDVNVTPEYFDARHEIGRARNLRFVTLQRKLVFHDAEVIGREVIRRVSNADLRESRIKSEVIEARLVAVHIETPPFCASPDYTRAEQERDVSPPRIG